MNAEHVKKFGQYLTPVWAAEAIVERHFSNLTTKDVVVEPTCGAGAFLGVIPPQISAVGVEIDPLLAEMARKNTGREVIVGDFCKVSLDVEPTVIIGNPPFSISLIDQILNRAHFMLPEGGRVGFLLPAYMFQTANHVVSLAEQWSIMQEMLPRNFYPNLSKPLVFAQFIKDKRRQLFGFALYYETADVQKLPNGFRDAITAGGGPVWVRAVKAVMEKLGGEADLQEIYNEIEGKRPTKTNFWRPQIRKVVRENTDVFTWVGRGRYALNV